MEKRKIMGSMWLVTFKVTGGGDFPWDMLRYDRCFPLTSDDAHNLTDYEGREREVVLGHYGERCWGPTVERWRSFLWTVEEER